MTLITIENVEIKGLTVEIKSLVVGRKQLTLSLMRQFINESIVDEDYMLLKGVPWGFINYFWGDDKDKTTNLYIHLIWQKQNELRRCVLRKNFYRYDLERDLKYFEKEINSINQKINILYKAIDEDEASYEKLKEDMREGRCSVDNYWYQETPRDILKKKNEVNDWVKILEKEMQNFNKTENMLNVLAPKYNQLIMSMKDLPHFFIAV